MAAVEGADADPGPLGDVLQRHLDTQLGEDLAGGSDDPLPAALGVDAKTGATEGWASRVMSPESSFDPPWSWC